MSRTARKSEGPAQSLAPAPLCRSVIEDYEAFILVETFENVAFSLVPRADIAPIAATAIRAAIRPYSMAVAPLLFLMKLRIARITKSPCRSTCFLVQTHGAGCLVERTSTDSFNSGWFKNI